MSAFVSRDLQSRETGARAPRPASSTPLPVLPQSSENMTSRPSPARVCQPPPTSPLIHSDVRAPIHPITHVSTVAATSSPISATAPSTSTRPVPSPSHIMAALLSSLPMNPPAVPPPKPISSVAPFPQPLSAHLDQLVTPLSHSYTHAPAVTSPSLVSLSPSIPSSPLDVSPAPSPNAPQPPTSFTQTILDALAAGLSPFTVNSLISKVIPPSPTPPPPGFAPLPAPFPRSRSPFLRSSNPLHTPQLLNPSPPRKPRRTSLPPLDV